MTDMISNAIAQIRAKLGFHRAPDSGVLKAGDTAHAGLLDNPAYPNTPIPLPVFRQALDTFNELMIAAEDGGRKAISAKQKQRVEVIRLYRQLGHYVEAACNGDQAAFDTSGFRAVSRTRTPPQALAAAKFRLIERGPNSGQTVVRVENQAGAIAFDVRYALEGSDGAPGAWTPLTLTTPKKVIIGGLTRAGIYQFQVRALGKLGHTDWSPSVTFIAA